MALWQGDASVMPAITPSTAAEKKLYAAARFIYFLAPTVSFKKAAALTGLFIHSGYKLYLCSTRVLVLVCLTFEVGT